MLFAARTTVAALAVALLSATARAAPEPYGWGPPMMLGWGWPYMIAGPFVMLLVLVLATVAVVLAVRWFAGPWAPPAHGGPAARGALDILNERFARGDIDQAEYETKRRLISQP